jgi:AraC-like DNA-binding protein
MRYLLLLFLVLVGLLAFGQQSKLDSLYGALENQQQEDSIRVKTLLKICWQEYTTHPEKSKAYAEEALQISRQIKFPSGEGGASRYIAIYYNGKGSFDQAIEFIYKALLIFERIHDFRGIARSYQTIGSIHRAKLDFAKSKEFYLKAIDAFQKVNDQKNIGGTYTAIGALHITFEKFDLALEYILKSLEITKTINDKLGISQNYTNLAIIYTNQNKYKEALSCFEKSIPIFEEMNYKLGIAVNFDGMGDLYTLMGNYDKAESCLLKALRVSKEIGFKSTIEMVYSKLSFLEKTRGHFKEALEYSELESKYQDSLYTEENATQVAEMETRYETEKKNQTIQLLERDKRIQQLWTNIFVITSILLFIVSMVIYFFQRYREQKNRRIFNLEIDNLIAQRNELSEKYKEALAVGTEKNVESHDQLLLKKAIEVIEANISDTLFGVEQMADKISMSRTSLHRKLKAITGFPPSELIRNIRLRKAASLLRSQSNSVTQISIAVGFEDQSYFSKSFKKQFGVPPSEYLQSTKLVETL